MEDTFCKQIFVSNFFNRQNSNILQIKSFFVQIQSFSVLEFKSFCVWYGGNFMKTKNFCKQRAF